MKLKYLTMIWLLLLACAPDKSTQNNRAQKDYILNPPDFEELERQKAEMVQGISIKKPILSKADSMKAYIKELTHHFRLQEKQMKALEYIYIKYDEKEMQLNLPADSVQLAKTLEEKERTIERVLGEHLYASKSSFDKQYVIKLENPKGTWDDNELDQYLNDLAVAVEIDDNKKAALKRLINSYDDSIKRANNKAVIVLNNRRDEAIKKLLGENLFEKKTIFDKTYFK